MTARVRSQTRVAEISWEQSRASMTKVITVFVKDMHTYMISGRDEKLVPL